MKKIPLPQGQFALVDDEDFELLNKYKWSIAISQRGQRYATTTIKMHRAILNAPKHLVVDHINGDTLDNTRKNIRLANKKENMANSKIRKDNELGIKGVTKIGNSYRSRITIDGKTIAIGYYKTKEAAANAYEIAARKHFGKFYNRGN